MPSFAYKARNSAGELIQGTVESVDSNAAASALFGRGVTPIEIEIAKGKPPARAVAPGEPRRRSFFDEKVSHLDLMLFSRQMYTLLKAGVPMLRALTGLEESASNKTFATVLRDLREGLEAGRELSASLELHPTVFSSFYTNMVRIGEMTGRLDEIFLRLYEHVEFEKAMRDQVKSALRYPTFVISTMAVAVIVINVFVIPAFAKVYKAAHAKLPVVTQFLIDFSTFTRDFWPLLLTLAVGGFFGFRYWTRQPTGRRTWDRAKLRIPIAGKIILKATLARFARSLALATRSGVPIVQSLTTVAQTVDNDYLAAKID
jgi:MSHA biogenesis protein MshG